MKGDSTKIYISEENFKSNINYLKKEYNKEIIPVIKSNGYGHGINIMANLLLKNNIGICAVSRLKEAEKVHTHPLTKANLKVLIFENIPFINLKKIKDDENFIMTIHNLKELKSALDFGIKGNQIQIKLDFGFGRNGLKLDEISPLKNFLEENDIKLSGIYSYLFLASYNDGLKIRKDFENIISFLGRDRFSMIHLESSVGLENYGALNIATHIRPGMLIYGLHEEGSFNLHTKEIFSLKSRISRISKVKDSDYIGYKLKSSFKNRVGDFVGLIKLGFGDGFLKANEGDYVYINNKPYLILLITMDTTLIEIDKDISLHDEVHIYSNITKTSKRLNMASYEILSLLNSRIDRKMVQSF